MPARGGRRHRSFHHQGIWFIGHVGVESDVAELPGAGQIVSASAPRAGRSFRRDAVPAAEVNIRKLLVDNGYFDPDRYHRLDYDDTFQQVNITFVIETGKRATIQRPQIHGDTAVLRRGAIR